VHMIGNQRRIKNQAEPLPSHQEHNVEEHVKDVLREDQGVQRSTLIYGVLVVGFQLIKCDDMKYCKEYEEGVDDERNNVGEGGKRESHL